MRYRLVLVLLFSFLVSPLYAASFDCSKATTEAEKAICADLSLGAWDELMSSKWSTIEKNNELINSQKSWLTIRDQCGSDKECITALYKIRMRQDPFLKNDEEHPFAEEKWQDEVWVVDAISEESVIASINGQTTHGDRLRVRFIKDNCDVGNLITTVYTTSDNPNLKNFEDIDVNANFMGFDIVANVLFTQPFLIGHISWVDLGWIKKDILQKDFSENKNIRLSFVNSNEIKILDYFDISINSWGNKGVVGAIERASIICNSIFGD